MIFVFINPSVAVTSAHPGGIPILGNNKNSKLLNLPVVDVNVLSDVTNGLSDCSGGGGSRGWDLEVADLEAADLEAANLEAANLEAVDLEAVGLAVADLEAVVVDMEIATAEKAAESPF